MIDPRTQHEVPGGDDRPERAWHNRLSDSIHDTLTFATLADANDWAADYPTHAVDGRHAWVTAENAVYVRSSGAWAQVWPTPPADTTAPLVTDVAAGWEFSAYARRRNGVCTLKVEATTWPDVAIGGSNTQLCRIEEGFRPGIEAGVTWSDHAAFGRIGADGLVTIQYRLVNAAAGPPGNAVIGFATFVLA